MKVKPLKPEQHYRLAELQKRLVMVIADAEPAKDLQRRNPRRVPKMLLAAKALRYHVRVLLVQDAAVERRREAKMKAAEFRLK